MNPFNLEAHLFSLNHCTAMPELQAGTLRRMCSATSGISGVRTQRRVTRILTSTHQELLEQAAGIVVPAVQVGPIFRCFFFVAKVLGCLWLSSFRRHGIAIPNQKKPSRQKRVARPHQFSSSRNATLPTPLGQKNVSAGYNTHVLRKPLF